MTPDGPPEVALPPGPAPSWLVPVDLGPGVRAGFTTAGHGLAPGFDDDDAAVLRHRAALARWLGAPPVFLRQVHGAEVHVVGRPARGPRAGGDGRPGADPGASAGRDPHPGLRPVADADAVVGRSGAAVAVLVADCVPVLLADVGAGVVAAVHAGRRGVAAGVVAAAVGAAVAAGADRGRLRGVVGPAVCGACYEVPAALQDEVAAVVPVAAATTSWGTPSLDLPAAVRHQLRTAGVDAVSSLDACTVTDARWYSHRAAGAGGPGAPGRPRGRFAGVVALDASAPACRAGAAGPLG